MKELEPQIKTTQAEERNVKQEYRFIGSMKFAKGLKLYSFDPLKPIDGENLTQVHIERKARVKIYTHKFSLLYPKRVVSPIENRVNYDPKLVYFQALNYTNAERKAKAYLKRINKR